MTGYSRISVPPTEYRDEAGVVIPCGSRWTAGRPPEDFHSRVSYPQRFEPLQGVARQLITYLGGEFEVEVASDPLFASEFSHPSGVGEVVRLAPAVPLTAPLTFGFTSLPGVFVAAGAFHQFAFPACGCDVCDEGVAEQLDQLEEAVFGVVDGALREWAAGDEVGFSLGLSSGSHSGTGSMREIEPDRLAARVSALPPTGGSRAPWPKRR